MMDISDDELRGHDMPDLLALFRDSGADDMFDEDTGRHLQQKHHDTSVENVFSESASAWAKTWLRIISHQPLVGLASGIEDSTESKTFL